MRSCNNNYKLTFSAETIYFMFPIFAKYTIKVYYIKQLREKDFTSMEFENFTDIYNSKMRVI